MEVIMISKAFVGAVAGVLLLAVGVESYLLYGVRKKLDQLEARAVPVSMEQKQAATAPPVITKNESSNIANQPAQNSFIELMRNLPEAGLDSWDPWKEMAAFEQRMHEMQKRMRDAFDANFGAQGSDFAQVKIQLLDKKDHFEVDVKGEGLDASSVNVNLDDQRYLKISGTKTEKIQERGGDGAVTHKEVSQHFMQAFALPAPVQADKMQVQQGKDGLKIILPK
jgi:HSP20 family molecular chaperone IbpA